MISFLLSNWKLLLVAALLALLGVQTVRVASLQREAAVLQLTLATQTKEAEAREREKERQWSDRIAEISTNAEAEKNALAADLAASRDAAERLRSAASTVRRACPRATAAATSPGEPGADPLDLLFGVLERHSRELVEVGDFADRLVIAGRACERSYDAIQPATQ